jgi:adenylate kinase
MVEKTDFEHLEPFKSILIFGPPGSGKGTQGRFLSSAGNLFHLSSGDIFRGLSLKSSSGKLYYKYANQGLLVPDDVTVDIWRHYTLGLIATNLYFPDEQYLLLDGLPRTVNQANLLEKFITIESIIVLDVKDYNILIDRMQKRALIEKRQDDMDADVLKKRFEIYRTETEKVLSIYKNKNIYFFEASQKPLEILRDILDKLCHILA